MKQSIDRYEQEESRNEKQISVTYNLVSIIFNYFYYMMIGRSSDETKANCKRGWWIPTSPEDLRKSEEAILSEALKDIRHQIGYIYDKDNKYRINSLHIPYNQEDSNLKDNQTNNSKTIDYEYTQPNSTQNPPLVLIHGFGGGIGIWCMNLRHMQKMCFKQDEESSRDIYAIDLLGFGRSTRINFPKGREATENLWVNSIEQWRAKNEINSMILLGHSLGSYLSIVYAINYPTRVAGLILADPWGFTEKHITSVERKNPDIILEQPKDDLFNPIHKSKSVPSSMFSHVPLHSKQVTEEDFIDNLKYDISREYIDVEKRYPLKLRAIGAVLKPFNPLAALRIAGPWGPTLIQKVRPDIRSKFTGNFSNNAIYDYLYHCNAQSPTGESGFRQLHRSLGLARYPILHRIEKLSNNLPLFFIYGKESWCHYHAGVLTKKIRDKLSDSSEIDESKTFVHVIPDAGHHVYVDQPSKFNRILESIIRLF
ncbi:hypothetical protein SNEBB_002281 [Seison nebaliae]|nr:hypothetical protein SNEBB_002281 [Seison nebaliae]